MGSVIICSHKPRPEFLRRTLSALQAQRLPKAEWELILVDSASPEPLAQAWDLSWHPHARHVREDARGKLAALLRGIDEASGEFLVIVDDDNVLDTEYLQRAIAIFGRYPYLGVFGAGDIHPEFEVPPAPELVPKCSLLALRSIPSARWSNNLEDSKCFPWGAGMCVTRRVAEVYVRLIEKLNINAIVGPQAERLFRGDDDLVSWAAVLSGSGFGLFPELRITHLISAQRLNRPYFLRLIHDHAFSHAVLGYLLGRSQPQRINIARYLQLTLHGIRNGQFSARCQLAESSGEDSAARFLAKNQLRPIELESVGCAYKKGVSQLTGQKHALEMG